VWGCAALLVALVSGRALAQEVADPAASARFRIGPLRFTPGISVTDLGLDTNVFNEVDNPKEDRTAALGPAVNFWLNLGRSRFSGKSNGQYLYFDKYANQRAWNTSNEAKWELPLARMTPFIGGAYQNTKNRSGFEIDSRVRTTSQSVNLGTTVKLSGRSTVKLSGTRSHVTFDDQASFLGSDLSSALDQASNAEELQFRYRLTSLTTFVVMADGFQDRFEFDALRNANSIRIMPGFEMKPSALISGKANVGYRRFDPLAPTVPKYQGFVAAVDVKYVIRATQIGFGARRDLSYSYQNAQPYYVLTDVGLSINERLTESWDVVVRGSQQALDYVRALRVTLPGPDGAPLPAAAGQRDTIRQYGGGIGYHLGRTLRLGVDALYFRRRSSEGSLREYEGLRVGASISFGITQ